MADLLRAEGVETRPFFYPVHTLPIYRTRGTGASSRWPMARGARAQSPVAARLSRDDVDYVCDVLKTAV